jgi:hypothetical protein
MQISFDFRNPRAMSDKGLMENWRRQNYMIRADETDD